MEHFWHSLSITKIKEILQTDTNKGLTQSEVLKRLQIHGLNILKEEKKTLWWQLLISQFKDFLIIILLIATGVSFALGEVLDAIIILVIVVLSALLGFIQEFRSQKAVEALKKMAAPEAEVLRNGQAVKIQSNQVVPGDILILRVGDKVAADARLFEEIGLEVDEAVLTGESTPVEKEEAVITFKGTPLGDRKNMVYSGTIVTRGHGQAMVVGTGMQTEFGKIAAMLGEVEIEKTPLEKRLEQVGRILGISALGVCALASTLGILRGYPFLEMFMWGVSLAVAAVPEALPAVVTGSLSLGVWEMAKKKAIVRRLPAVETLGSISVICSDKTGTLTKNEMTVKEIFVDKDMVFVEGSGYEPEGGFLLEKGDFRFKNHPHFQKLCQVGLLCNDAVLEKKDHEWQIFGDPTEGALVVLAAKAHLYQEEINKSFPRVGEAAFDMERKRMTTIHSLSKNKYLIAVKGAPEQILKVCNYTQKGKTFKKLQPLEIKEILDKTDKMARSALRVLALAYKEVDKKQLPSNLRRVKPEQVENNLIFLGLVGMIDPPREEAIEAVKSCFAAGIQPMIVTGDHLLTTLAIGQKIGLFKKMDPNLIIESKDLDKISDDDLIKIVNKRSYCRVSPAHKLRIIKLLKQKGLIVAMTGDGINDAPALKQADIGVAMGITGTEVTKEASDMVLADDNFATIVLAIRKGREIYDNIKKYLFYLLRCNIGEILVLGGGFLFGLPPVMSAIQILWINLMTDGLPALALGIDPPDPKVMERKPIAPRDGIFSKKSLILMFVLALNMMVVLLPQFGVLIKKHDLIKAQTIVFATMVFMELLNAYNSRTDNSLFSIKIFGNKWLNLSVLFSLLATVLIIQIPKLSGLFKTVNLSLGEWGMALGLSLSVILVAEGAKLFLRKT